MPSQLLLSFCLFTLILHPLHHASAHSSTTAVEELDLLSLDSSIQSSAQKPLLLEIYIPWCTHCIQFAPKYEQLALHLKDDAVVARIDGDRHRLALLRFRVRAFPSFYLIHSGTVSEFEATHSQEALSEFVDSRGRRHGKKLSYFGGPLSPYWSAVSTVFWLADLTRQKVTQYQSHGGSLLLLVFCIVVGVVAAFILVIHIITSPSKYTASTPPTRPHAE